MTADIDGPWSSFGRKAAASTDAYRNNGELDWALIEIMPAAFLPNYFLLSHKGNEFVIGDGLKEVSRRSPKVEPDLSVVVLTGKGGAKWGQLSRPSSLLRIGSAGRFVQTYSLRFVEDSGESMRLQSYNNWH